MFKSNEFSCGRVVSGIHEEAASAAEDGMPTATLPASSATIPVTCAMVLVLPGKDRKVVAWLTATERSSFKRFRSAVNNVITTVVDMPLTTLPPVSWIECVGPPEADALCSVSRFNTTDDTRTGSENVKVSCPAFMSSAKPVTLGAIMSAAYVRTGKAAVLVIG